MKTIYWRVIVVSGHDFPPTEIEVMVPSTRSQAQAKAIRWIERRNPGREFAVGQCEKVA